MDMDLFGFLRELINIPSPTGAEGRLADFLAGELRRLSFRVLEQPVEGDRRNLWATFDGDARVVLCTHMDTVPGAAAAREDVEFIHGRGACDAKGSLAAMVAAARDLAEGGCSSFGLLFVVGEESDSLGARRANALAPGSEFIIVGEPTDNRLGLGHKGTLFLRLKASGRRAHSALPQLGESAVEKLLDVLAEIRREDFGTDSRLGPTLVNIGQVEGGVAANVVPDEAAAVLGIRPAVSVGGVLARLAELLAGRAEIEILTASEPQRMWTLPGIETAVFPFGTDIPYLTAFGKPFLFGPGSVKRAHAEDERVEKKQLAEAVRGYRDLVRRLLSGEAVEMPASGNGGMS